MHEDAGLKGSLRKMRTFRYGGPDLEAVFAQAGATPWEAALDTHEKRQVVARIKQARERAGLTQDEMADLLGITQRGYAYYESEKEPRVPFARLGEIAEVTHVSRTWLLDGDNVPSEDEAVRQLAREMGAMRALLERIAEHLKL